MFIAIIGTRCSGKTTIESYLVAKGFVPVRIIGQALGHEARIGDYREVSPSSYLVSLTNQPVPSRYQQRMNHILSLM